MSWPSAQTSPFFFLCCKERTTLWTIMSPLKTVTFKVKICNNEKIFIIWVNSCIGTCKTCVQADETWRTWKRKIISHNCGLVFKSFAVNFLKMGIKQGIYHVPSITNIIYTQRLRVLGSWGRPLRWTKISYQNDRDYTRCWKTYYWISNVLSLSCLKFLSDWTT